MVSVVIMNLIMTLPGYVLYVITRKCVTFDNMNRTYLCG